ncbi:winged helix-turn-helix domain-containing protein [Xanthobacter autotrophicus]|uniref:Winged helix-turn-helix domain-containing protein n=1 Tax=Xanthobacter autotrophicus TaxID=280 RepID=A0A6C1KJX8_XANAU|nr:winged helix-turn-helix domain-containing protein [Xanthobacter autotrophicus]
MREAVGRAYPWPATLTDALAEVKAWDSLAADRGLFCRPGEWTHYAEVRCRVVLLEDELETGRPAASWDDMQARFDWKRYAHERTWRDPQKRDEPFLERLEADFAFLRANAHPVHSGHPHMQPASRRTTADKRADVLSMLDTQPELSDREIARRTGVSPQTVGNHRRAPKPAA